MILVFIRFCSELNGSIKYNESWGLRNLAYPINNNKKAFYEFMNIEIPGENIKTLNGRIVKFLKIANGKVYFQIMNPYDLDSGASGAIGSPDFENIWCRFYPIWA